MASVNKVIIVGNVGADPELRQAGPKPVCNFRVACNEKWKDKSGQMQERTEWVSVTAWDKLGELCATHLSKGRQVYVEGKLQTRKWTDKEGVERFTTEVNASSVVFLGKGEANGNVRARPGAAAAAPDEDFPF